MAEELETLWQKLKVTEEEELSISLGEECTKAANERGKYCLVLRVLSRRGILLDALRKNIRMLWKPNKSLQLSMIEEELFLAEFEDERDKKRVMDMRPWHYEKQLVLLQEFEGEQDPKDIVLKWSPFWVQIYNLPLKSRTRETGKTIGASLGKVVDVDVADNGVQWGKYLRVRVEVDVTRKLIRGRKINIVGEEARWVHFKYERLPNFCYRCGLLEHDLRECPVSVGRDKAEGMEDLQYGAWLRGEPTRRLGGEYSFANKKESGDTRYRSKAGMENGRNELTEARKVVAREKQTNEVTIQGVSTSGELTKKSDGGKLTAETIHEEGKVRNLGEKQSERLAQLGKKKWEGEIVISGNGGSVQKETGVSVQSIQKFEFKSAQKEQTSDCQVGLDLGEISEGPVVMMYDVEVGWVEEKLGPNSSHWKRRARAGLNKESLAETGPIQRKREGPTLLEELDKISRNIKRRKGEVQRKENRGEEKTKDGGEAVAATQHRRAQ